MDWIENVTHLFRTLLQVNSQRQSSRSDGNFWLHAGNELLRNALRVLAFCRPSLCLADIAHLVAEAPASMEEVESEVWRKTPHFGPFMEEAQRQAATRQSPEMEKAQRYWLKEFPGLAYQTRSCMVTELSSLIDGFYSSDIHDLFCRDTSLLPEATQQGATVVSAATAGIFGIIIGVVWALGFTYFTWEHRCITVPNRYRKNVRWHSRSDGIPRVPGLNNWVQAIILIVAAVIAFVTNLHGFGILLLFSFQMSLMADLVAAKQFWNRVLDAVDGQIEAEELGKAIEQRLTPDKASGLKVCVPAYVSEESRRKIAGTMSRVPAPHADIAKSQPMPMPTNCDLPTSEPATSAPSFLD